MTAAVPGARPRPARVLPTDLLAAVVVLGVLTLVHLAAHLGGADRLADATQWLLMPALAAVLAVATRPARTGRSRSRLVRVVLLALGFSWLGDALPDLAAGDTAFLLMVGGFLLAQTTYVVAFWPYRRRGALGRPLLLVPYAAALVALLALCVPHAGPLAGPVVVYGAVLTAMAVTATGLGPLGVVGGAVFLVSDALIALDAFVPGATLPRHGFAVMLTYVVGQTLLVLAVLRRDAADHAERLRRGHPLAAAPHA